MGKQHIQHLFLQKRADVNAIPWRISAAYETTNTKRILSSVLFVFFKVKYLLQNDDIQNACSSLSVPDMFPLTMLCPMPMAVSYLLR